jgi:hypothetical protein
LKNHPQISASHTAHDVFRGCPQIDLRAISAMKQHLTMVNLTATKLN